MEPTHIYVPVEPNPDYTQVSFTRVAVADATDAQKLIVQQLKDHAEGLLNGQLVSKETMVSQLKDYFEGTK